LREHTVALDAAAAARNQHPCVGRDVSIECGNLTFAENDLCGVVKREVSQEIPSFKIDDRPKIDDPSS
jgi:hypothetical protein